MVGAQELQALKDAYAAWSKQSPDTFDRWRSIMGNRFHLSTVLDAKPGLQFATSPDSPDKAIAYLKAILADWEMVHYTPEHYICEADKIAMFGTCAFKHRVSKDTAYCRVSALWIYEGGKAIALNEVFDSAEAVRAAMHTAA